MTPSSTSGRLRSRASNLRPACPAPCDQKAAARDAIGQVLRRTGVQQLPLGQQQHFGAALGLVEVRRAPHDADSLIDEFVDHLPQLAARDRIDPDRRFVQKQQPRLADQSAGQSQFLFHPARQITGQPAGKLRLNR